MNLTNALQRTWRVIETAAQNQQIKNHELFVLVFCKTLDEEIEGVFTSYDGRRHSNSISRPNFFIWQDAENPKVIFVGKLRFAPDKHLDIQNDISSLKKYIHKSSAEVLAPALIGKGSVERELKVSPDIEIGYFIVGDLDMKTVHQSISSCALSPEEKAKLHIAFGVASDEKAQFQFIPPISEF